ncbi:hypothetical protein QBC40DRAFT_82715 [Triangularia verruculosa]|uniref:Uncharacterized protein n=1 Tax=Triangularia verruculosa TaxID=2587418 RepID=A0AAN6XIW5_9PEZI|nr:hypothetical protein QBC40DRAFT_82715 [Triangularia verruculosa]
MAAMAGLPGSLSWIEMLRRSCKQRRWKQGARDKHYLSAPRPRLLVISLLGGDGSGAIAVPGLGHLEKLNVGVRRDGSPNRHHQPSPAGSIRSVHVNKPPPPSCPSCRRHHHLTIDLVHSSVDYLYRGAPWGRRKRARKCGGTSPSTPQQPRLSLRCSAVCLHLAAPATQGPTRNWLGARSSASTSSTLSNPSRFWTTTKFPIGSASSVRGPLLSEKNPRKRGVRITLRIVQETSPNPLGSTRHWIRAVGATSGGHRLSHPSCQSHRITLLRPTLAGCIRPAALPFSLYIRLRPKRRKKPLLSKTNGTDTSCPGLKLQLALGYRRKLPRCRGSLSALLLSTTAVRLVAPPLTFSPSNRPPATRPHRFCAPVLLLCCLNVPSSANFHILILPRAACQPYHRRTSSCISCFGCVCLRRLCDLSLLTYSTFSADIPAF